MDDENSHEGQGKRQTPPDPEWIAERVDTLLHSAGDGGGQNGSSEEKSGQTTIIVLTRNVA
jgi:hypothetical protein